MARNLDKFVRRYTTLSSALDSLTNRRLVLLNPKTWDDTNDVDFMEFYRQHTEANSVLALCCAQATETYHHWRVFTQGMEGVCLEFRKDALLEHISAYPEITAQSVEYLLVRELAQLGPENADKLPFVKRDGYSDEREWRIVATLYDKALHNFEISITLDAINRLILNPWLPPVLGDNLRNIIRKIPGCEQIKIDSSRLTNSSRWKEAGRKLISG